MEMKSATDQSNQWVNWFGNDSAVYIYLFSDSFFSHNVALATDACKTMKIRELLNINMNGTRFPFH